MRITPLAALRVAALLLFLTNAPAALAADPDTVSMKHDPARYGIVVSATKTTRALLEVPNAAVVVRGSDLRRTGARTLADALVDVVGVETGGGSDAGSRLPQIAMWGLKEIDALLITLDGVPVGGPFNPALEQIAVDDIDRIEIVKGPQGTLHGVSAFAGMVQVFTNRAGVEKGTATLGGGSFDDIHGRLNLHRAVENGWNLDVALSGQSSDGWQERTSSEVERGRVSVAGPVGRGSLAFDLSGFQDRQDWGSPLPVDAGEPLPGFETDRNYAVLGAVQEHHTVGANMNFAAPLGDRLRLENTIGVAKDRQNSIRSFPGELAGDTLASEGVALRPITTTMFDDLRLVTGFDLAGRHDLVTGAAITWGRTKAEGIGFDIEELVSDESSIPHVGDVPVGDNRSFADRRTLLGAYAHDEWTPVRALTISGGGRFDQANEKLHAFGQEVGGSPETADDARTDQSWSGDIAALVRLVPDQGAGALDVVNLYGNLKSSFKPAAPNLTEPEGAKILDPERTHSIEAGVKGRAFDGQLGFDASIFQLDFHNLVVSNLDENGEPELINSGHTRFKGVEVSASISPHAIPGLSLSGGWAHHDPRFVEFTFVTPDGELRNVSGKIVELAPRELWNARAAYAPVRWLGGWVSARHQGIRPLTRRNTFFAEAFDEVDAGLTFQAGRVRLGATGRNLGDDRHYVAESDIGDSQFYVSPPKRYSAEMTISF